MNAIDRALQYSSTVRDAELRCAIVRLSRSLADHLADTETYWTFSGLSRLAGVAPDDPVLMSAVRVLCTEADARLLDMHFLYYSPVKDTDGEPIDDSAVTDAYKSGFIVDPYNGEEIVNFEECLVPYFQVRQGLGYV
ncbi:hypothetical protein [Stenotrophomonas maltophilia]|uniref:hypothetical protein n=1 Tax=Stenotrophomonas maltophilia TaxID=40324 RepID=UPI00163A324E|nr:hypothetical protein [Stenotrophomonas maltophilia]HDS1086976.1 hypothetical protein [Stenotrophomonas maltophilia]